MAIGPLIFFYVMLKSPVNYCIMLRKQKRFSPAIEVIYLVRSRKQKANFSKNKINYNEKTTSQDWSWWTMTGCLNTRTYTLWDHTSRPAKICSQTIMQYISHKCQDWELKRLTNAALASVLILDSWAEAGVGRLDLLLRIIPPSFFLPHQITPTKWHTLCMMQMGQNYQFVVKDLTSAQENLYNCWQ